MSYQTGHSVTVSDDNGTSGTIFDLADYGVTVLDGSDFPHSPEPYTETVNVSHKIGGYTYYNNPLPATLTLRLCVEAADQSTLNTALLNIASATATAQKTRIYPDLYPDVYWIGRRISGIPGITKGRKALIFDMVFALDDPRQYDRDTEEPIS